MGTYLNTHPMTHDSNESSHNLGLKSTSEIYDSKKLYEWKDSSM